MKSAQAMKSVPQPAPAPAHVESRAPQAAQRFAPHDFGAVKIHASDDAGERAADAAAHAFLSGSTALGIRAQLRASAPRRPIIQRAVTTWGGEFVATKYEKFQNKLFRPEMVRKDGVVMNLEFRPNEKVDATRIGLVQSVVVIVNGRPTTITASPAEEAVYRSRMVAKGPAEGRQIDQFPERRNPLYAAQGVADPRHTLATTRPDEFWGHHGHRFTDARGPHRKEARLNDQPTLEATAHDSGEIFETTALAVAGAQRGTYYGSVSWGFRKRSTTVEKLPLRPASRDAPTRFFGDAAAKWNVSKIVTGERTIPLPVISARFAAAADTPVVQHWTTPSIAIARVAKNTRVEVIDKGRAPWWKITIVDGMPVGRVGWVLSSALSEKRVP